MKTRWAVFISGRGSNLSAVLNASEEVSEDCVHLVVSSSAKALGLLRARRAGIPTFVLPRPIDWQALDVELKRRQITQIFLLGFMRVVPEQFVAAWQGKIVNLHPSLLPLYPGLHSIELAFKANAPLGVSVHEVTAEVDAGALILQRRCLKSEDLSGYSLETSEFQVHLTEQRCVKEAFVQWRPLKKR